VHQSEALVGSLSCKIDSFGVSNYHSHFRGNILQFGTNCTNLRWRLVPLYVAKYDAQMTHTGISDVQVSW
jgi:hypothetical protein